MNWLKTVLFNLYFYSLLVLITVAATPVGTVIVFLYSLFVPWWKTRQFLRWIIHLYGWFVIYVLARPLIKVSFEDRQPGQPQGPAIFVFNHRSSSDPFLIAVMSYDAVQVVKRWPFRLPLLGVLARLAQYVSIQDMAPEAFFAAAGRLFEKGVSLAVYPEGTRSGGRQMGPFHSLFFRLALQSGVPIVPCCISGNERCPAKGSMLLRPAVIRIRKLPVVTREHYKDLNGYQLKTRVHRMIEEGLAELDGQADGV